MITGTFSVGLVIGLTVYFLAKEINKTSVINRLLSVVFLLLEIYCAYLYAKEINNLIFTVSGCVVCVVLALLFDKKISKTKFYLLLCAGNDGHAADMEEEDFMNTKLGKIITVLVVFLIIYAIASTACIYRLNQKINSMVVITDELREEIGR